MQTSHNGINLIKEFEGCRLTAYKCPAGVWTIGYGHTSGVKSGQTITQQQADNYLREDLKIYENYVKKIVKLELNQNQFDALVSFCYNCGPGNLQTLVKNRTLPQIADCLLQYNKGGGVVLNGLVRRRKAERALFLSPVSGTVGQTYKVTAYALNVRAGIGTSYRVVDVLRKNTVVTVLSTHNGWGKISNGWISLKYTKKV